MKTYMGPKRSHSLLHVGQGTWASNVVHDIGPQKVVGRSIDTRSSSRRYEKEMRGLPWDFGWQKRPRPPRPCCPALFMRGLYASTASSKPLFFWEAYAHWRAVLSLVLSVHLNSFRIQGEYEKTSLQPTRKMCVDKHKKDEHVNVNIDVYGGKGWEFWPGNCRSNDIIPHELFRFNHLFVVSFFFLVFVIVPVSILFEMWGWIKIHLAV